MPWGENQNDKGPWGQEPRAHRPSAPRVDPVEELIAKAKLKLQDILNSRKGGGGAPLEPKNAAFLLWGMVGIVALLLWLVSGVYTVNTKEEAVILRFGKYVRTAGPGLNYHLPTPIETLIKLRVTDRYITEVGYRAEDSTPTGRARSGGVPSDVGDKLLILTGDENLVDVNFEVQWQISDARKFLFNVYDPERTIRNASESAMREIVGTTPMNAILSDGRTQVQQEAKKLLQQIVDSYDVGVTIEAINMRAIPPMDTIQVDNIIFDDNGEMKSNAITTTVDEAFKDVQAALINKQEIINTAIARSNEVIPEARGDAERVIQQAKGYKEQVVAKAEGEAKRFVSVYNEYKRAKEVTRQRMYLETMEDVLKDMDKVIIDTHSTNGVVPYLPLKELEKKPQGVTQ